MGQNFFWRVSEIFWVGSNCTKVMFEAGPIFYICLESNLKEDYLKIGWKLEGLS